jgi:hypothetical protein
MEYIFKSFKVIYKFLLKNIEEVLNLFRLMIILFINSLQVGYVVFLSAKQHDDQFPQVIELKGLL